MGIFGNIPFLLGKPISLIDNWRYQSGFSLGLSVQIQILFVKNKKPISCQTVNRLWLYFLIFLYRRYDLHHHLSETLSWKFPLLNKNYRSSPTYIPFVCTITWCSNSTFFVCFSGLIAVSFAPKRTAPKINLLKL